MSKHTPGTWRASFKTNRTNNLGIYTDAGLLLATVEVHQLADKQVMERRKQDARLMAAGPALLKALQACADYMSCIPESAAGGDDDAARIYRDARAAIGAAEGAA